MNLRFRVPTGMDGDRIKSKKSSPANRCADWPGCSML